MNALPVKYHSNKFLWTASNPDLERTVCFVGQLFKVTSCVVLLVDGSKGSHVEV